MKLQVTVTLTIVLLLLMLGASVLSAMWGFALGRSALQGVTQPDVRPNGNTLGRTEGIVQTDSVKFFKEEDIIKQVEAQIADPSQTNAQNNG